MSERTYPVVELFGPTIQGEGPSTGERCWFLRLGGCDYRCSWCDSMHAVDPELVRQVEKLNAAEIVMRLYLEGLRSGDLLILSGGNPALHHLDPLMDELREVRVHVETQGTRFRGWLNRCEMVVVSPKPPSAFAERGMAPVAAANRGLVMANDFVRQLTVPWALKVVVFDNDDLDWAAECRADLLSTAPLGWHQGSYLSAGTAMDTDGPAEMVDAVIERYRWLVTQHTERDDLARWRVGLQQHVLAWPGELAR